MTRWFTMRLLLSERVSSLEFRVSLKLEPGWIRQATRRYRFYDSDPTLPHYGSDLVSRIEIKHTVSKPCGTHQPS